MRVTGARNRALGVQKVPIVAHRRNFREWLVTMTSEVFFRFLRGDFSPAQERPPISETKDFEAAEAEGPLPSGGPANNNSNNQEERNE